MFLRYQIKTIIFSDNFILITILCDSYKRRKTLMKKIYQRLMKLTDRKQQQIYRNSYFRSLRQRYCFLFSHNSLIKSIVLRIYLSRKIDFEKLMKQLKNFQNYNYLYKFRISRSSSHLILFSIEISLIIANTTVFMLRSTLFNEFLISVNRLKRRVLDLIFA